MEQGGCLYGIGLFQALARGIDCLEDSVQLVSLKEGGCMNKKIQMNIECILLLVVYEYREQPVG